jgi:hypothetical protein
MDSDKRASIGNDDYCQVDKLPSDVIEQIFLHLPSHHLVKTVALVCKRWQSIIKTDQFWIQKSTFDTMLDSATIKYFHNRNVMNFQQLYFKNPFNRNLLKNPCGSEGLSGWCYVSRYPPFTITTDFGDLNSFLDKTDKDSESLDASPNIWEYYLKYYRRDLKFTADQAFPDFIVEPGGLPVDQTVNYWFGVKPYMLNSERVASQFATTFFWCRKFQVINLVDVGLTGELCTKLRPRIEVVDNYAARMESSSQYRCLVALLNVNFKTVDSVEFGDVIGQWNNAEWHKWTHVFDNISDDARYILFYHEGKDCQRW